MPGYMGYIMTDYKYQVRSVQKIGELNYLVELERLTTVGWLWWKRLESEIKFFRTDVTLEGIRSPRWYEEATGKRAYYLEDMLDAAVRKYTWEQENKS